MPCAVWGHVRRVHTCVLPARVAQKVGQGQAHVARAPRAAVDCCHCSMRRPVLKRLRVRVRVCACTHVGPGRGKGVARGKDSGCSVMMAGSSTLADVQPPCIWGFCMIGTSPITVCSHARAHAHTHTLACMHTRALEGSWAEPSSAHPHISEESSSARSNHAQDGALFNDTPDAHVASARGALARMAPSVSGLTRVSTSDMTPYFRYRPTPRPLGTQ